ncbi:DNA polymerase III subunit delta [Paucilactobacillus hokkaidonensis JCM 18461]|uniref:DNA polymerase III subunit delta n=2 Tax=Paucilactobacillus hokkaidonensis TaxID=1193095 RepID=A0A0A1GZG9_9LACO|nr:DNA polymerase III subunit delta [Paucilactobacillus hokkaidonensis]KRO08920.1 DNA polymerase III, delta subunit [Paucilactobacillus hokkaidonensis]BAP85866.1 DNA polymerase III subunit delta [Paucilactobacillus hokkaidonensis JCM 18461]
MDVTALKQQLKQNAPDNVYLVIGTQGILRQQARDLFNQLIPEDEKVMNVGSYDMEVTPLATALDDAVSAPFFGERRLVLITKPYFLTGEQANHKIDHDVDGLLSYLEHPQPDTVLVLFAPYEKLDGRKKVVKRLNKVATQISAAPLSEQQARQSVLKQVNKDGYQFENGALDTLVQRTNADYELMAGSIAKLELFGFQAKQITQAGVIGLVPQSLDQNVFDLVNAVLKHDQKIAVQHYQDLIGSQEQPLKINAVLVGQFRLLIQIKVLSDHGLSQGSLAGTLKVHPYRVKLGMQTVRAFSLAVLQQAYLGLVEVEQQLKTTQREPQLLFELFMLRFGREAS